MSIASAPTLDDAVRLAVEDMVELISQATRMALEEAYMLISVAGHLRISQVVDPRMTVRMVIGKFLVPELILEARRESPKALTKSPAPVNRGLKPTCQQSGGMPTPHVDKSVSRKSHDKEG